MCKNSLELSLCILDAPWKDLTTAGENRPGSAGSETGLRGSETPARQQACAAARGGSPDLCASQALFDNELISLTGRGRRGSHRLGTPFCQLPSSGMQWHPLEMAVAQPLAYRSPELRQVRKAFEAPPRTRQLPHAPMVPSSRIL